MYKVFFNNNVLFINNTNLTDPKFYRAINAETEGVDFKSIVDSMFEQHEESRTVLIYKADVYSLWKEFKKQFKFIEASGGMVENEDGRYLFIERNGKWDVPKGKCEKGESIEACAVREITEECGIERIKIVKKLLETYHTYHLKGKKILKRTTWYVLSHNGSATLVPQTEEGITQVKWLAVDEIYSLVIPNTYLSIKELVEEAFSGN